LTSETHPWLVQVPVSGGRAGSGVPGLSALGRISLSDLAIVIVLVFFGVSGAIPGVAPNQAGAMTGTPPSHIQAVVGIGSELAVNLCICAMLLRHLRLLLHQAALLWCPLALGAWAVASMCWSVDPLLTGRRAIPFLLAACLGGLLAIRLPPRRVLLLLLAACTVLALWSAVLALAFPSIGLDASTGHGGDWQGAFTQKNACGRAMVLALAALLALLPTRPQPSRSPIWQLALGLLFGAELVLSGSRGAWLIAGFVFCVMPALQATHRLREGLRTAITVSAGGLLLTLAIAAATYFAQLAPLLGRDATLSGRTEIWRQVWIAIADRPCLGYGFSAFWQGFSGPSWNVVVALHFVLFHAHNGLLEIWLELGVFGVLLFLAIFLRAVVLLWPELRCGRLDRAAWPLAVLLLTVLYDFDENTLLAFNGLFWVLYCGALVQVEMLAAQRRERCRPRRACALPHGRAWPVFPHVAGFAARTHIGADAPPAASTLAGRAGGSPWL
jgi:exopolysaccharide production protein ExoQ